ncbi:hypothetical protein [Kribbella qitaiheensis]|uniref:hypothetical protein n=1 Tax=Kribbella qitaiheensis TaxID=1544730 RepID=UPI0019D67BCC|nr:hypothetical protein [Kribbella qitaiheensis]
MLTSDPAGWIPDSLRRTLGARWDIRLEGDLLTALHRDHSDHYTPPRRSLAFADLLDVLESNFAMHGVPRARPLPLRWGRDTDLTVSAVQALDPFLKDGQDRVYRSGFLPQPVVRLTGQRDDHGELRDGFLTSFVNISHIQPITHHDEFAEAIDIWLSVLSRLGMHARHITIYGHLKIWQRDQVQGITLRFRHLDLTVGDINLLWNANQPQRMAVDLGSGLERLAWARSRSDWKDLVFGPFATAAPLATLDAIRTTTLLLGHGIRPGPQRRRRHNPPNHQHHRARLSTPRARRDGPLLTPLLATVVCPRSRMASHRFSNRRRTVAIDCRCCRRSDKGASGSTTASLSGPR